MTINNKLIILRYRAGLTQEEVAKRLKISKSSYCRKEKGNSVITTDELERLLDIYEATYDDFIELKFPVIHDEKISTEYLDELERVLEKSKPVADFDKNRDKYNSIQDALRPVLNERDRSFDFPEIDTSEILCGTTVKQVNLDIRAEVLIRRAFQAQSELAHSIFGAVM